MVYTGTIVSEAEMTFLAGSAVDATGNTEANHNFLAGYAEAYLSNLVKYDIVTNWANINSEYKTLFSEWAGRFAASQLILYNTTSYNSLIEAEDSITMHTYRMQDIQKILAKADVQDFIGV